MSYYGCPELFVIFRTSKYTLTVIILRWHSLIIQRNKASYLLVYLTKQSAGYEIVKRPKI